MKTSNKSKLYFGLLAVLVATCVQAYPGESVVLDQVTGNYIITYRSSDPDEKRLMQTEFVPATKIVPTIHSAFRSNEKVGVFYHYSVSNAALAKQGIVGVEIINVLNRIIGIQAKDFDAPLAVRQAINAANNTAMPSPAGWHSGFTTINNERESIDKIYWTINHGTGSATDGILAGQTLRGFGFASYDLPGVGESRLDGVGAMFGYPDEGPDDDSAVLAEIDRLRDNDYISKPVATPSIAVPMPFDAAVLLDRIRAHVSTWPSQQLVDSAYAIQLDRRLVAAADAYRLNNAKVGKEHIEAIRKMLEKEHHYLDKEDADDEDTEEHKRAVRFTIDRLAARVLDFDLKYVLKRMKKNEEHELDREHKDK